MIHPRSAGYLRLPWVLLTLVLAMAISASPSQGQAQARGFGALAGEAVDEKGDPISGARVDAVRADGASPRWTLTDRDGRFRFEGLVQGAYHVTVRRIGFQPTERAAVLVRSGAETVIRVELPYRAEVLDTLMAIGKQALEVRRSETEFATRIEATRIDLLPLSYDPRDIVSLVPGARADNVWGGASAQANNYQIDGLSANHAGSGGDLIAPSMSWVEAVEVRGLGAGAEHGNFQGGLVNVVTKRGTNRRVGSLRLSMEHHRLNASNLGSTEIGGETLGRAELEGEAGGPLIRDRLFLFAGLHLLQDRSRFINHLPEVDGRYLPSVEDRREKRFFAKLNWHPSAEDVLEMAGGSISVAGDNVETTGYEAPGAAHRLKSPVRFGHLSWRREFGRNQISARMMARSFNESRLPYQGTDVPGVHTFGLDPQRRYQNADLWFYRASRGSTASASWTTQLTTGAVEMRLMFGGEHDRADWVEQRQRSGGMTWRPARLGRLDLEDPTHWTFSNFIPVESGGEVDLHAKVANSAAFAQATMTFGDRVTLAPGVRWGRWEGHLLPRGDRDRRFLAVADQAGEPRLGLTLDLTGRESHVLKAHWGRYHQSLFAEIFDRVEGGEVFSNRELWYLHNPEIPSLAHRLDQAQRDSLVQAGSLRFQEQRLLNQAGPALDYNQPFVDQVVIGLESMLNRHWKASAVYVDRRNRQMVGLVDRNVANNYSRFQQVRVYDRFGDPVEFHGTQLVLPEVWIRNDVIRDHLIWLYREACGDCVAPVPGFTAADIDRLGFNPDYVLTNLPAAERHFRQWQFTAEGAFAAWGLSGSVVWTRLEGNLDNVSGYVDESALSAGPFTNPNELVNAHGRLPNFSNWEWKVAIHHASLPGGVRGGVFFNRRFGDYYTPHFPLSTVWNRYSTLQGETIDHRLMHPTAGQHLLIEPRGSRNFTMSNLLDLRIERDVPIGGTDVGVSLAVFNVLGDGTVVDHNTSVNFGRIFEHEQTGLARMDPNAFYRAVRQRVPPRTMRLATVVRF